MKDIDFVPLLSVIIVGHNDEREAAPLVNEVHKSLQGHIEYEILYVDDGSTDGTHHNLIQLAARLPVLEVVQLTRCSGPTAALMVGINSARGVWVTTLNGNGSNDPADIPAMFEMALQYEGKGPLLVAGHRGGSWKSGGRLLADGANSLLRRIVLGEDAGVDPGCIFTVCTRELWQGLPWFDHVHHFLPTLVKRTGGRVISVPVNFRARPRRPDSWGRVRLWSALRDLLGVRWLQARQCRAEITPPTVTLDTVRPGVRSR